MCTQTRHVSSKTLPHPSSLHRYIFRLPQNRRRLLRVGTLPSCLGCRLTALSPDKELSISGFTRMRMTASFALLSSGHMLQLRESDTPRTPRQANALSHPLICLLPTYWSRATNNWLSLSVLELVPGPGRVPLYDLACVIRYGSRIRHFLCLHLFSGCDHARSCPSLCLLPLRSSEC